VLAANSLLNASFIGVFSCLAANLIQSYGMCAGETVLPGGPGSVIVGGYICGRVAYHSRRLMLLAISSLLSGLMAALVFIDLPSFWPVVVLAFRVDHDESLKRRHSNVACRAGRSFLNYRDRAVRH